MNKKITLLMAVFFALAACSEDVDQELDQQTSGLEEGYFPDSDGSGGINLSSIIKLRFIFQ